MNRQPGKISTTLSEMEAVMTEKLREGGSVRFSPKGKSMLPMLRAEGDSVTLKQPPAKPKKGMVALFVSEEGGERHFVLHRLVRIGKKDGLCVFCGDNRRECDPPVPFGNIIGVVSEYESRGREHSLDELWYRLYSLWMVNTYGFRRVSLKAERFIYGVWKKTIGKKK